MENATMPNKSEKRSLTSAAKDDEMGTPFWRKKKQRIPSPAFPGVVVNANPTK